MGVWSFLVYILLPLPLVALLLLCLPLPQRVSSPVRRGVNGLLNRLLFGKIFGTLNLYQIATSLSILLFLESTYLTVKAGRRASLADTLSLREGLRCQRWREERNFWITLFSLVLWLILFRVHKLSKDFEELREQTKTD